MKSSLVLFICFSFVLSSAYADNQLLQQAGNAIRNGDLNALQDIARNIDFRQNINNIDANGNTLLNMAIEKGDINIVRFLIAGGADVNQSGKFDDNGLKLTPLDTAAKYDRAEIADLLINTYRAYLPFIQDTNFRKSPLQWAVEKGFESYARLVLDRDGSDVNNPITIYRDYQTTMLHHIATLKPAEKYIPTAKLLIERGANVNAIDRYGRNPIYYALKENNLDLIKLFIDNKASLDVRDYQGKSPLHEAVTHRELDVVNALIKGGANVNQRVRNTNETALHLIAQADQNSKNIEIARVLVRNGIDFNATDAQNKKAVDYADNTIPENAAFIEVLKGNNALTLCANIILISFLLIGTMIGSRLHY